MPKVNVYLPDDLARDVRRHELPMSSICQAALRVAVVRVSAADAQATEPVAIAARLLATQQVEDDRQFTAGFDSGAAWAQDVANLRELQAMVRRHQSNEVLIDITSAAPSISSFLLDRNADRDLPYDVFDELDTDKPFDRGFIEGVAETYATVEPYLGRARRPN